ncbi:MAG: hypothetical protein AAB217_00515 [Chloroflexota bacterium]
MTVELAPLKCVKCETMIQANEEEVAWTCPQCGQGNLLAPTGLAPLPVHWCVSRPGQTQLKWLPFWVFTAVVNVSSRQTYGGNDQPDKLWREPRRFYIPAFTASLEQMEKLGADLTKAQPALTTGLVAGSLADCTLPPEDAISAAEFVVITIEADRRDKLREIHFAINTQNDPELWLLPFNGEPSLQTLAIL